MAARTLSQKWLIPDVYPLLAALGGGAVLSAYAGFRCLYKSPEVIIRKETRHDQLAETDWFEQHSDMYEKSMFRTAGKLFGRASIFPNAVPNNKQ